MRIERICETCGKKFTVTPSSLKFRSAKYCCKECYIKSQKRNKNNYVQKDGYCELRIENKFNNRQVTVLISNEDIEKVKLGNWCACYDKTINGYYIRGTIGKQKIQLHRYITNCPKDLQVDHINRNTLDNRRENLRTCTNLENAMNRSINVYENEMTGINYHIRRKKYCLIINHRHIGIYETIEEAKQAKKDFFEGKIKVKPKRVYRKKVKCIEENLIFESILKASKKLKINRNLIEQCCNNKRETAGGYHWEVML